MVPLQPWIARFATVAIMGLSAQACSIPDEIPDDANVSEPRGRLETLANTWLRTPATIIYQTMIHEPGEPRSGHQCLRQLVGGRSESIDIQTGLRICLHEGELRLEWDPPDRWRMDVTDPSGAESRFVSTDARDVHPFRLLVDRPQRVMREIGGGSAIESGGRTIAGSETECYSAEGASQTVRWCFSRDAYLLYVFMRSADGTTLEIEATDVRPSGTD